MMAIQTAGFGLTVLMFQTFLVLTPNVEAFVSSIQIETGGQARGVPIPGPNSCLVDTTTTAPTSTKPTATTLTSKTTTTTSTTSTPKTATLTTTSTPTTTARAGTGNKEITANQNALEYINRVRMSHNAPSLTYDPELHALAKNCARMYALQLTENTDLNSEPIQDAFKFQCTRDQTGEGNELILTVAKTDVGKAGVLKQAFSKKYTPAIVKAYNFEDPKLSELGEYQYFTQMLWKSSTKMGCACEPEALGETCACSCIFTPPGNTRFGHSSAGLVDYVTNVQAKK